MAWVRRAGHGRVAMSDVKGGTPIPAQREKTTGAKRLRALRYACGSSGWKGGELHSGRGVSTSDIWFFYISNMWRGNRHKSQWVMGILHGGGVPMCLHGDVSSS